MSLHFLICLFTFYKLIILSSRKYFSYLNFIDFKPICMVLSIKILIKEDEIMAKKISNKKPLSVKLSSHAKNKTNSKQNPNLQTYTINGVKVRLTAREARTLKKASK